MFCAIDVVFGPQRLHGCFILLRDTKLSIAGIGSLARIDRIFAFDDGQQSQQGLANPILHRLRLR